MALAAARARSANGQPALAFYSWDDDEGRYLPFALNVLTFRGEQISEVDAFITRSIEDPDRRRSRGCPSSRSSHAPGRRLREPRACPPGWTERGSPLLDELVVGRDPAVGGEDHELEAGAEHLAIR